MISEYRVLDWSTLRTVIKISLKKIQATNLFDDMQLFRDVSRKKSVILGKKVNYLELQESYNKFMKNVVRDVEVENDDLIGEWTID